MKRLLARKHHINVSYSVVMSILQQMDPVGVADRRQHRLHRRTYFSRGLNYMWHADGYDKLRPYGILINGYVPVLLFRCLVRASKHVVKSVITVAHKWQPPSSLHHTSFHPIHTTIHITVFYLYTWWASLYSVKNMGKTCQGRRLKLTPISLLGSRHL